MRASVPRLVRSLTRISPSYRLQPLSKAILPLPSRFRLSPIIPTTTFARKYSDSPSILPPPSNSSLSTSPSESSPSESPSSSSESPSSTVSFPLAEKPSYQLTFTCKKCSHRSSHKVTKQAYHKGTVLIQCPGCEVRHLIADHLKIFRDKPTTIEDILREKGEKVRKGVMWNDGDIEILPDEEESADVQGKEDGETK